MVRWKRTAKSPWYYLPQVFTHKDEALARGTKARQGQYRIETVEIAVVRVLEGNDDPVQGQNVD